MAMNPYATPVGEFVSTVHWCEGQALRVWVLNPNARPTPPPQVVDLTTQEEEEEPRCDCNSRQICDLRSPIARVVRQGEAEYRREVRAFRRKAASGSPPVVDLTEEDSDDEQGPPPTE